jgi:hypothetical protein
MSWDASRQWGSKVVHCPEDTSCTGLFEIYAYLLVVETTTHVVGAPTVVRHKILPIRFQEVFKVERAWFESGPFSIFSTDDVKHCSWSNGNPAAQPYRLPGTLVDDKFWYAAPHITVNPDPPAEIDHGIEATTTFAWQEGTVLASGTPSVSGKLPLTLAGANVGTIDVKAGVPFQITTGATFSQALHWRVWYERRHGCKSHIDLGDDSQLSTYNDAKGVYDSPDHFIVQ